jgi:hypothetical protein
MQRGLLNGTKTAITSPNCEQCWSLDSTNNSSGFRESDTGGSWTLIQSRATNTVNEITGITNSVGASWINPTYDATGNMTTIPTGLPVATGWFELDVADWSGTKVDDWSNLPISHTTDRYAATYDAWNRLMTLADPSNGNTVQQNQYDARLFQIHRSTYSGGALDVYCTPHWQVIEVRLGDSTVDRVWSVIGGRVLLKTDTLNGA